MAAEILQPPAADDVRSLIELWQREIAKAFAFPPDVLRDPRRRAAALARADRESAVLRRELVRLLELLPAPVVVVPASAFDVAGVRKGVR